jgi:WD40 repeat protein
MEVTAACVPVTALHVYHLNDRALLLSGQASTLVAHDGENQKIIFTRRIFGSQVIHGISAKSEPMTGSGESVIQVLLWAGNTAALLRLRGFKESIRDTITLELTNLHVIGLCDWALFGDFFEFEPRELEQPYIVTAHNEVYKIALHRHPVTESSTESCEKLVSGPRSVLYSAYARSASTGLLIAAGTVFGEVVVWTANKNERSGTWTSKLLNVLLGHRGSIFGVCISENVFFAGKIQRLLATCSDDRSIRLWKISEEGSSSRLDEEGSHPKQLSDGTGFGHSGNDSTSLLAMAWGHASRIWNVRFLPTDCSSETRKLMLVSTGEDASIRFWLATDNITVDDGASRSIQLRETGYYGNHSGKNIWSSDHHSLLDRSVCYTGGADGSIIGTALESTTDTKVKLGNYHIHMSFGEMFDQGKVNNNRQGNPSNSKATALKYYAVANDGSILATTANGDLVHGKLDMARDTISWQKIYDNLSRSPLLICSDRASGSVFFALPGGDLCAIGEDSSNIISSSIGIVRQATLLFIAPTEVQLGSQERHSSIIIPLLSESRINLITVKVSDSIRLESRVRLLLPQSFVPTSGCHHLQQGLLVLGSRSGSIAIYDNLVDSKPAVSVFYNLHSTDTITSIMFLHDGQFSENNPAQDLFVLTTGRDGTYAVHMIGRTGSSDQAWILQTVHRSTPPIGPNIEGAYLVTDVASQIQKLVLYGFRSKEFVVWNETEQTEVLAVDCGGAHRSWTYSPSTEDGSGSAVYGGTFVWTKAGACHVYENPQEDHCKVQDGGHGREIKALAILHPQPNSNGTVSDTSVLVATGAEDTTIRLFEINASESGVLKQTENKRFSCIRILSKHTTGIHHLEFSPCGDYLISSGGCEELFVWRLHKNVPVVGLGVVLESMLPKTDVDADARITSFRVGKQILSTTGSVDGNGVDFETSATYSNGKVKTWKYSCEHGDSKGRFELLEEIQIGSFCLTVLENDAKDEIMLTAGTNGYLNIHFPWQWSLLWKQKVHQNSIQASLLVKLPGYSSTWLVVTGGDDNALGLTVFCPDSVTSRRSISAFATLLVPKAHAAAITGLTWTSRWKSSGGGTIFNFASVSNDGRVKIWRVTVHEQDIYQEDLDMHGIQVEKNAECWTNVADAAAIEVLDRSNDHNDHLIDSPEAGEQELLVVGVGMEMLKLPMRC